MKRVRRRFKRKRVQVKRKTPRVNIQNLSLLPSIVTPVATAIPVFIGYSQKAHLNVSGDLLNSPKRISFIAEYEQFFGSADWEKGITINVATQNTPIEINHHITNPSNYSMFYALQLYFLNGGGPCYIVSVGDYSSGGIIQLAALLNGLKEADKVDEITLINFPDGTNITPSIDYYALVKQSLHQCNKLKDRFTVCDVYMHNDSNINDVDTFRNTLSGSLDELKYGAAYYPYLETQLNYQYQTKDIRVNKDGVSITLDLLETPDHMLFNEVQHYINSISLQLPPSSAVLGMYAQIDERHGVWKAPANVNLNFVIKPSIDITGQDQEILNVDVKAGKSINAIRSFTGRGTAMVWGARTLAGNDNEWRYIPVRRLFNMVKESITKATKPLLIEPNNSNTWLRVKVMIENFLNLQWRAGALAGAKPEQAFFVKVGLSETMTAQDILENRLIIEIGMAGIRPAEFIIMRLIHKMIGA